MVDEAVMPTENPQCSVAISNRLSPELSMTRAFRCWQRQVSAATLGSLPCSSLLLAQWSSTNSFPPLPPLSPAGILHRTASCGPRRAFPPPLCPPPGVLPWASGPLLRPLCNLLLPLLQCFLLLQENQHQFPLWQELVPMPQGCLLLAHVCCHLLL